MNHGILSWRSLIACGALLCAIGLFGPEFPLWGAPNYVWALLVGILLVMVGLSMAVALAVTGRLTSNRHAMWWAANSDDVHEWRSSHEVAGTIGAGSQLHTDFGGRTGPLFNVDGTPMLDDLIDVAGKVYGDSGDSFNYGFAFDLPDGGFSSGSETHHTGSTTW